MGEKEIKPAGPTVPTGPVITDGPVPGVTSGVASDGSSTMTKDPAPTPAPAAGKPQRDPRTDLPRKSSWSGEVHFPDDFRMGRETSGEIYLTDPSGTRATWNPGSEQWTDPGGKPMPDGWSEGHRTTRYTTGPSGPGA